MRGLLGRGSVRFALLIALVLAFYVGYRHTIWLPRSGRMPEAFTLLPVSDEVWHTAAWVVFAGLLLLLSVSEVRPSPPRSDLGLRRLVLLAVFAAYALTAGLRLATGRMFGLEETLGPAALIALGAAALVAAVVLIWWPPRTPWLFGILVAAGLVIRLALQALIPPDPAFADNVPAIERSLERLVAGLTPYAVHDFGTHQQTMPYLPLTFLSYLPAYLLGIDIRLTNLVLAAALTLAFWIFLRALPLPPAARNGFVLIAALLFVLPLRMSHDLHTAWAPFNLLLTGAFLLIALGRVRAAAVAYGASLAAMPVALFVAPPLLLLAARTRPLREVAVLAAIVLAVGGLPTLLFVMWDVAAFSRAFSYGTTALWERVAAGDSTLPLLLWHGWLGGWLLAVQAAAVAVVAALSWRGPHTVRSLVARSAVLYLVLVITGPHIAQYMTAVVLYLALLQEAVRAAGVTAGDRELGLARRSSPQPAPQPASI